MPSVERMAEELAARMLSDGRHNAVVFYSGDAFGLAFQRVLVQQLIASGMMVSSYQLGGTESYGELLRRTLTSEVDAIALASSSGAGATLVQDWAVFGGEQHW